MSSVNWKDRMTARGSARLYQSRKRGRRMTGDSRRKECAGLPLVLADVPGASGRVDDREASATKNGTVVSIRRLIACRDEGEDKKRRDKKGANRLFHKSTPMLQL